MEKFGDFKCPICDTVGQWLNVDEYRLKAHEMCMCKLCGFITYPSICMDTKSLNDHYTHEYRDAPSVQNMYSCERKLHYHSDFLNELFEEWRAKSFTPKVLEIGAAFGMALHWIRANFPKAELCGTELTRSFVRNAWHTYKIKLDPLPDYSKKYDLIMSYKVAEHIPNIDVELRKSVEAMTPDGRMYISVPVWFKDLTNSGFSGFDIEYYYDKNHVNVWSQNLFEALLKKVGLEVIKTNFVTYGATYLCKRNDDLITETRKLDDPEKRLEQLKKVLAAGKAALELRFGDAIKEWPNYPEAHLNHYEMNRNKAHQAGWDYIKKEHLDKAIECCPESAHIKNFVADVCMRYEKFDDALKHLKETLDMKPNEPSALVGISHVFRQLALKEKNPVNKARLFEEARAASNHLKNVSKQSEGDALTWIMQDNARIPCPFEFQGAQDVSEYPSGILQGTQTLDHKPQPQPLC